MFKRSVLIGFGLAVMLVAAACGAAPPTGTSSPGPTATRGVSAPTTVAAPTVAPAPTQPAPTSPPPTRPAPTSPPPTAVPQPTTGARPEAVTPPSGGLAAAVANAQADLAQRLGIAPTSAAVVQSERMTWPDASLGCPQPGMMYAQVETPGYRVVLSAGGQEYDYRALENGQVRLCERPRQAATPAAPSPTAPARGGIAVPTTNPGQGSAAADGPWAQEIAVAQADLLKREPTLKAANIRVQSAEAVTWNDGSLGCPQPGMMYTMALVPGYRIVLEAGGQTYSYHGAQGRPPKLCQNPRLPAGATDPTK